MYSLTLTTSSPQGSVTLAKNDFVLETIRWHKGTSHSEKITPVLQDLFAKHKISAQDLELLICTIGPGSFTGIRVGLSAIRGLSFSAKTPILPIIDTLAVALARPTDAPHVPCLVMIDAQKNKFFCAIYEGTSFLESLSPQLLSPQELESFLSRQSYFLMGSGFHNAITEFKPETIKKIVNRSSLSSTFSDSELIFNYVKDRKQLFKTIHWHELSPLYMRKSSAEEVADEKMSGEL